jgi:hypothetical protein
VQVRVPAKRLRLRLRLSDGVRDLEGSQSSPLRLDSGGYLRQAALDRAQKTSRFL